MKEKTDKEIERIYLKIQKDWNLTGKITKDFVIVAIQEFNQENAKLLIDAQRKQIDFMMQLIPKNQIESLQKQVGEIGQDWSFKTNSITTLNNETNTKPIEQDKNQDQIRLIHQK